MAVWNPRWSAKGLDLGLELGSTKVGKVSAEGLRGERVGAGVVDGEFRGD